MHPHRDIGIAAALGGGTGTVLALTFGQHWLPGAILGIVLGALIGGLTFRPLEVATVAWRVLRERWRVLAFGAATFAVLYPCVWLAMRHPRVSLGILAVVAALGLLRLGWKNRTAVGRALLWFAGKALAVAWGFGAFAVGTTALPLAAMWLVGASLLVWFPEPFSFGMSLSVSSLFILMVAWDTCQLWRLRGIHGRQPWQWAIVARFLRLIGLEDRPAPYDPDRPLVPTAWGNLRINGQYIRWQEFRRLCRKTGRVAFIAAMAPLMAVGLAVTLIADVPITIALALASSKRLAAMEGALIGSAAGFVTARLGAIPPLAVALGAGLAVASAIGLYRLRTALERTSSTAAAPA
jgi:hypothetical protein